MWRGAPRVKAESTMAAVAALTMATRPIPDWVTQTWAPSGVTPRPNAEGMGSESVRAPVVRFRMSSHPASFGHVEGVPAGEDRHVLRRPSDQEGVHWQHWSSY